MPEARVNESLPERDALTGLYNHAFLQDHLEQEVSRSRRHGRELSLVLIDLDGFQALNETHKHETGDRVLRAVAGIVAREGRASDGAFRLVGARFGPDVLAIVLPETDRAGAAVCAERVREAVERLGIPADDLPRATVSVGVAAFPSDAGGRSELIVAAEAALAAAKRSGRNRVVSYTPGLGEGVPEVEVTQLAALERVIATTAVGILYQPIVKARGGAVVAYEALCRPSDPAFSSPIALIQAAEGAGRIGPLGRLLRDLAVRPFEQLPEPRLLFLNVHPLELTEALLDAREASVARHAGRIVLEITENAAIRNIDHVKRILGALKERGFRIALDDLGSGYSSLNSLASLEPDFVKLDMEMIRGIQFDSRAARLIKHVLQFTHEEGMTVVAEGIETEEERSVARDIGCQLLQGFLFSKAVDPFWEAPPAARRRKLEKR